MANSEAADISSRKGCNASCSAPGKLIMFGEHAVVYGITAVAAALSDLRLHVEMVGLTSLDSLCALTL